jgi:flagellar biogenesis protein FliO
MEEIRATPYQQRTNSWLLKMCNGLFAIFRAVKFARRERLLHLRETLPLGEKRLLAVVEFQNERFLIGATSQSIQMLRRLEASERNRDVGADFEKSVCDGRR